MAETLTNKPWALASLSVSNMRAVPDHASELVSQVMMGTPLKVLDFRDKFYQVQTPEGYLGWLDAKGLELLTEPGKWRHGKDRPAFFTIGFPALLTILPAMRLICDIVTDLVLGDLFEAEESDNGFLKIKLPDGRIGFVPQSRMYFF